MRSTLLLSIMLISASITAQETVTVSTAPGNSEQRYYSLQNGTQATTLVSDWDLAFESTGITGAILLNTAKGHRLYKAPYAIGQWAMVDTTGLGAGWPAQYNSTADWSSGAFNQGLTSNPFDLGWGIYNFSTHNITGDSLFILQTADGAWKKFRVDGFATVTTSFTFTMADLDGANEQVGTINRNAYVTKNFGYYSFATMSAVDLEPVADDWDLLFTKYNGFVPQPVPSIYPVTGVLQNKEVGVAQVDGIATNLAAWAGQELVTNIDVIGYDWKEFNMTTFMYEYASDRTYFVQDRNDNIWKLIFTEYGGGANGNITFTQELVSATSVEETNAPADLVVYPNPVLNGELRIVLDGDVRNGQLSIHDMGGKLVMQQQVSGSGSLALLPVDVSALQQGLYMVRLTAGTRVFTTRVVIGG